MKLSTAANKVIKLAEAIQRYWERELPKRHPNYPFVNPGEEDGPPPPEEKKLRDLLASLPEEIVYKLALIAHLGPGALDTTDLEGRYEALRERYDTPADAAFRLMTMRPLADYLADGLAELKKHRIDVDKINVTIARIRK
jgi:hypothetical protein